MDATQHFSDVHGALPPAAPWLTQVRLQALAQLTASGFPTNKDEAWKYTRASWVLSEDLGPQPAGALSALPANVLVDNDQPLIVLVDGQFDASLSRLDADGAGVRPLTAKVDDPSLGDRMALAVSNGQGFDALNAAFLTDGAIIEIAPSSDVSQPIHVVHVNTGAGRLSATRVLILAKANSRATVVEHFMGTGSGLRSANTEIIVQHNAQLTHIRVQDESAETHHVGRVSATLLRDARLHQLCIALGGKVSRVDVNVDLDQAGAEVRMDGLYMGRNAQHMDHHTFVRHSAPHTNSHELYKGILDDKARGVFTGQVFVAKDSQKIASSQSNHNLLLSDDAVANTRPQLQIFADDVQCAHGATIGRTDPERMFYLRSRGLSRAQATQLLTVAFANDVLFKLPESPLRDKLAARVAGWLET